VGVGLSGFKSRLRHHEKSKGAIHIGLRLFVWLAPQVSTPLKQNADQVNHRDTPLQASFEADRASRRAGKINSAIE